MRIIKESITCTKCNHVFTFEYPEKHAEMKITCPNCSAVAKIKKTKSQVGRIISIIIGIIIVIGLGILVWQTCVGGSTIC